MKWRTKKSSVSSSKRQKKQPFRYGRVTWKFIFNYLMDCWLFKSDSRWWNTFLLLTRNEPKQRETRGEKQKRQKIWEDSLGKNLTWHVRTSAQCVCRFGACAFFANLFNTLKVGYFIFVPALLVSTNAQTIRFPAGTKGERKVQRRCKKKHEMNKFVNHFGHPFYTTYLNAILSWPN